MDVERPDTTPGYEMESPSFTLTFVTGLQRGVASSMLEVETDWYVKLVESVILLFILVLIFFNSSYIIIMIALAFLYKSLVFINTRIELNSHSCSGST